MTDLRSRVFFSAHYIMSARRTKPRAVDDGPVIVAADGPATRGYVSTGTRDTITVPFNPQGAAVSTFKQGRVVEFTTSTDSTQAGLSRTVAVPYAGSTQSPGATASATAYQRQFNAAEVAAAHNLVVSDIAAADSAYYVAYIHTGTTVTLHGTTFTNPNVAVDSEASPTERSTQIIIVRYDLSHNFQYLYKRSYTVSGTTYYTGISGSSVADATGARHVVSACNLSYHSGSPNALYMVGTFKGLLNFGNGIGVTSARGVVTGFAAGYTISSTIPFAAKFLEDGDRNLTCDWATALWQTVTASSCTATHVATDITYAASYRCSLDSAGNLYFPLTLSCAASGIDADNDSITHALYGASSDGITQSANAVVYVSDGAESDATLSAPVAVKLASSNGALDATFTAAPADTNYPFYTTAAAGAASVFSATAHAGVVTAGEDTEYYVQTYRTGTTYTVLMRNLASGAIIELAGGTTYTRTVSSQGAQSTIYYDLTNHVVWVALASAVDNNNTVLGVYTFTLTPATPLLAAGQIRTHSSGLIQTNPQYVSLRRIFSNGLSATPTVSVLLDYSHTSALTVYNGAGTASSYTLPAVSAANTEYNSAIITGSVVVGTGAANLVATSALHFDQSNTATVGSNRVRGAAMIDSNNIIVGLGYFSDLSYTNNIGGTTTVTAGNTGSSISLTRGSSNFIGKVNLMTTESENRVLALLDSVSTWTSGGVTKYDALITPIIPGKVWSMDVPASGASYNSATYTPGNNYYISTVNGSLITSVSSNILLGFAIGTREILLSNPDQSD